MKYELLIAAHDFPGTGRLNEGDIISAYEYPHNFGAMELKDYQIMIVESTLTFIELEALIDTDPSTAIKRKYNIALADSKSKLAEIDIIKTQDPTKIYQPFKQKSKLLERFTVDYFERRITSIILAKAEDDRRIAVGLPAKKYSLNITLPKAEYDKLTAQHLKDAQDYKAVITIIEDADIDCGIQPEIEQVINLNTADLVKDNDTNSYVNLEKV